MLSQSVIPFSVQITALLALPGRKPAVATIGPVRLITNGLKIPRKCLQQLKKEISTEEKLTLGDYIQKWLVYYLEGKSSHPAHFLQTAGAFL